jgi:hypothetical protein
MYIIMNTTASLDWGRLDVGNIAERGMSCMTTAEGNPSPYLPEPVPEPHKVVAVRQFTTRLTAKSFADFSGLFTVR